MQRRTNQHNYCEEKLTRLEPSFLVLNPKDKYSRPPTSDNRYSKDLVDWL
ncbi:hypothetical protein [Anabaena sp. PCC 7108]|nr:hypothetical protein [Anabaena sp. PCC 7108]